MCTFYCLSNVHRQKTVLYCLLHLVPHIHALAPIVLIVRFALAVVAMYFPLTVGY